MSIRGCRSSILQICSGCGHGFGCGGDFDQISLKAREKERESNIRTVEQIADAICTPRHLKAREEERELNIRNVERHAGVDQQYELWNY